MGFYLYLLNDKKILKEFVTTVEERDYLLNQHDEPYYETYELALEARIEMLIDRIQELENKVFK